MTSTNQYDYIIVGAGSAGCVMAYRLSADPKISVLLLEAGGSGRSVFVDMPKGVGFTMVSPKTTWPYRTSPESKPYRAEQWTRGKSIGGSSLINGMMYVRGQPADYDEIARQAGPDWAWDKIGAAYKALENHELGAAATRGDSGPLHISMPTMRDSMPEALIDAGTRMGLPRKQDVNEPDNGEAVGYAPSTIYKGRRESAARAFIDPIRQRPNLHIETGVVVDKLVFSGKRVIGVDASREGSAQQYRCRREVIVAAGALASPAILQRSGIGSAPLLQSLGVKLIAESPEVGSNLREHHAIVMQWRTPEIYSTNRGHGGARLLGNVARYYAKKDGLMAAATYELGAWFKTRPELDRPDGQFLLAPYSFDWSASKLTVEALGGVQICAYILRPESSGSLRIISSDPARLPLISPDYHGLESDRRKMVDVLRYARRYMQQSPLAGKVTEETRPGVEFETDEQILSAYDRFGAGGYHASGTCRMGSDERSVVDGRLRVRGVDGLRVVDTSIFPVMPAGNTNGPAMAMAWRAADLVIADQ